MPMGKFALVTTMPGVRPTVEARVTAEEPALMVAPSRLPVTMVCAVAVAVALLLAVIWVELSIDVILVPAGKLALVIVIPTWRPWVVVRPVITGDVMVVAATAPVPGPVPVLAL